MTENLIEIKDVLARFKEPYTARFESCMMPSQHRALADLTACMTEKMGGHQYHCRDCETTFWVYHGCRNRACPACHGRRMREWLKAREAELLPCDYYHLVATVPEELRPLFLSHQKLMYGLLMQVVASAVIDLARDRKYLGATPGLLMVLHTWTGQMLYHPHVHLLVTGGGLSEDGLSWCEPPGQFLVPVKALSKLIAARFRDALKKGRPDLLLKIPRKTWKQAWCSFSKHYGHGKSAVLEYLARYAFRIAITNSRIVSMDSTHVTFQYKERERNEWKLCRLTGIEFLRRFLLHVLPRGFHKLRYFGLWHHSKRTLQTRAHLLLTLQGRLPPDEAPLIRELVAKEDPCPAFTEKAFMPSCPHCGSLHVEHLEERCRSPNLRT